MKNLLLIVVCCLLVFMGCDADDEPKQDQTIISDPAIQITNLKQRQFRLEKIDEQSISFDVEPIGFENYDISYISMYVVFYTSPKSYLDDDRLTSDPYEYAQLDRFTSEIEINFEDLKKIEKFEIERYRHSDQFEFFFVVHLTNDLTIIPSMIPNFFCNTETLNDAVKQCSFFFEIECEVDLSEIPGEWEVVLDDSEYGIEDNAPLTIVESRVENRLTILNPFNTVSPYTERNYDMDFSVNIENGNLYISPETAWDCADTGCYDGEGYVTVRGEGKLFSCLGEMDLVLSYYVRSEKLDPSYQLFGKSQLKLKKVL